VVSNRVVTHGIRLTALAGRPGGWVAWVMAEVVAWVVIQAGGWLIWESQVPVLEALASIHQQSIPAAAKSEQWNLLPNMSSYTQVAHQGCRGPP
jgi:hypothetical protein